MDVPTKPKKEEYAEDTVQCQNNAALMDVPIKLSKEEYAEDTVQCQNNAALMDVPNKPRQEEYAEDTWNMYPNFRLAVIKDDDDLQTIGDEWIKSWVFE